MVRDFINIDCMDGMNKYPDNYFGLAIVDPPYGIDICSKNNSAGHGLAPRRISPAKKKDGKTKLGGAKPFGTSRGGVVYRAYTV